ncbi:MAG: CAP domain-containing protein [Alphaproteobacteria bacterium]|nr:CAP domain-containing protein [Alphaproteobacteria bacterium]
MYRVILVTMACIAVGGCSLGTQSLSLNLDDTPATSIDPNFVTSNGLGDYADASTPSATPISAPAPAAASRPRATSRTRTAMLDDRAPGNSVTKAPPGALADRNYQRTNLDVAQAREMINAYRRQNGLKPLSINPQLTAAAEAHSRDLAKWDRISHYGSDGSNPWDRVRRSGYSASLAAENVGTGQATLKEVFAGWKQSPGHNKNLLLKDAKHMGIALIYDAKTEFKTFWTLVLGSKG